MAIKAFATDARKEFKDLTFETIMDNCIATGKEEWLKEAMNRQMPREKWQKTTVIDEATGKKKKVIDKTKPKIPFLDKPTFIELKEMYLVECCGIPAAVKKEKELTMAEKLAKRLAEKG